MRKAVPIHICVDTGIGRVGVPSREAAALIRDLARRRGCQIDGVMMTFTEDQAFDQEQLQRFDTLTGDLSAAASRRRRHAASSFALFQHPTRFSTWSGPAWRSTASIRSRRSGDRGASTLARRSA